MKVDATFKKVGDMRFISHLDLMRLFQRALRRACLPVVVTQGFSPHYKISVKKALKLGLESLEETLTVHLARPVGSAFFMKELNRNLPEGVQLLKAEEIG